MQLNYLVMFVKSVNHTDDFFFSNPQESLVR